VQEQTGSSVRLTGRLPDDALDTHLDNQYNLQRNAQIINGVGSGVQAAADIASMAMQLNVMDAYYDAVNNQVNKAQEIALQQIDLQRDALSAQVTMSREQQRHEQSLARIEKSMHVSIARIEQEYMTRRAETLATALQSFRVRPVGSL
jgi:hypothetical protein